MSDMSVAWRLGSMGTCNVSVSREWDRHGRLVGRSVDLYGPIDHDSVGLAQARPNHTCDLNLEPSEHYSQTLLLPPISS